MIDMFKEIDKNEKNEKTAFIIMLGVLSEKLTEIINLLSENKTKFNEVSKEIKKFQELQQSDKQHISGIYILTNEDYD